MPLDSKFLSASIVGVSANAFKLSIDYSYYNLYNYSNVYVYDTLQKCKDKLIIERTLNKIKITDHNGVNIELNPGDG